VVMQLGQHLAHRARSQGVTLEVLHSTEAR
jgi:hypothetical protein